ncbi:MAG: hypothetical protein AAF740_04265 [Bacteroidota bacterium]
MKRLLFFLLLVSTMACFGQTFIEKVTNIFEFELREPYEDTTRYAGYFPDYHL